MYPLGNLKWASMYYQYYHGTFELSFDGGLVPSQRHFPQLKSASAVAAHAAGRRSALPDDDRRRGPGGARSDGHATGNGRIIAARAQVVLTCPEVRSGPTRTQSGLLLVRSVGQ